MMMAFRRVETVVVQRHLGFIERELTEGFERSALSVLHSKGVRQWWDVASAFSNLFSAWVDENLASNLPRPIHAGLGLAVSKNEVGNEAAITRPYTEPQTTLTLRFESMRTSIQARPVADLVSR